MSNSIERIENLIRVVSNVRDDKFDLRRWYSSDGCGCAIGHAMRDAYFTAEGFKPNLAGTAMADTAEFFDISENRAMELFVSWSTLFVNQESYGTRKQMLAALRVLLLEKMAQKLPAQLEGEQCEPVS